MSDSTSDEPIHSRSLTMSMRSPRPCNSRHVAMSHPSGARIGASSGGSSAERTCSEPPLNVPSSANAHATATVNTTPIASDSTANRSHPAFRGFIRELLSNNSCGRVAVRHLSP
ncbi:MAG: hypothetical protein KIS87_07170 [Phycisphaeraceae bacterium]|nr:hypothetical protein [Phycisphaeraceae bacterium]